MCHRLPPAGTGRLTAPARRTGEVLIHPDVVGPCGTGLDIIVGRVDPLDTRCLLDEVASNDLTLGQLRVRLVGVAGGRYAALS